MAMFKCKMCGGALEVQPNATVAECEYCGMTQTLPKLDDGRKANLYDRANHFRRNNEFDKAAGIYEQILNEDGSDAETYWSLVLCRYGIEYVEDPATHKRVPTVNRAQFTSVFDDDNYKSALNYADGYQRSIYEDEAKAINEIQKGILEISQKEEPFDVFICYKETDANGRRTPDSVLANDLYHQLIQEGFKVFFARITLEDKLGTAYEPYIFAALNSSKVMVVLGTKPEHFNAVWVKNEWSRYLALIKTGAKKMLIPAYKDMDPYDLPEEFSHLQAQDMSKLGFMQDLIRGVKKILAEDAPKSAAKESAAVQQASAAGIAPLLKRAFMFLEDGEWKSADEYCEKVLDQDPENAQAYLGKLMANLHVRKQENLKDYSTSFEASSNCQKVLRFGDQALCDEVQGYIRHIEERNEEARLNGLYEKAASLKAKAKFEDDYRKAAKAFAEIAAYRDAAAQQQECLELAEITRKDILLNSGKDYLCKRVILTSDYEAAISRFEKIPGWKDADEQIVFCKKKIEEIKAQEEKERLERERQAEIARKEEERKAKRNRKIGIIAVAIVFAASALCILTSTVIIPAVKYKNAVDLMEAEKYEEAIAAFEALDGFKDSEEKIHDCKYNEAVALMDAEKYEEAKSAFSALSFYKDSAEKSDDCHTAILDGKYNDAVALMDAGKYVEAMSAFAALSSYKDSAEKSDDCHTAILDGKYNDAVALMDAEKYEEAIAAFEALDGYKDSAEKIDDCNTGILDGKYNDAVALMEADQYSEAILLFRTLLDYKDSKVQLAEAMGEIAKVTAVAAGGTHTVGLKTDGTTKAVGNNYYGQRNTYGLTDIIAVAAGEYHTVGLKADGTVVAVGDNIHGQCDVSEWTDIVAISAGFVHTVGLKADGTVVAVGYAKDGRCDVSTWTDIVAISAKNTITVGLRADGTVVAVGDNEHVQCNVSEWTDIVAISAGGHHTVGLKADGTVVAVGYAKDRQCMVSTWTDIVAISAGYRHTVGLKADGTVVAVGLNDDGQCDVSEWTDIVAIFAGGFHTIGLKADGRVVAVGLNDDGQCDVGAWRDIKIPG